MRRGPAGGPRVETEYSTRIPALLDLKIVPTRTEEFQDRVTFWHSPDNRWHGSLRVTMTLLRALRRIHPECNQEILAMAHTAAGIRGVNFMHEGASYARVLKGNGRPQAHTGRAWGPGMMGTNTNQHGYLF